MPPARPPSPTVPGPDHRPCTPSRPAAHKAPPNTSIPPHVPRKPRQTRAKPGTAKPGTQNRGQTERFPVFIVLSPVARLHRVTFTLQYAAAEKSRRKPENVPSVPGFMENVPSVPGFTPGFTRSPPVSTT